MNHEEENTEIAVEVLPEYFKAHHWNQDVPLVAVSVELPLPGEIIHEDMGKLESEFHVFRYFDAYPQG